MAKILIIEDETNLLDFYAEILEMDGHTVSKADDGERGLEAALNNDWEIMFLDIMLPGLDGIGVLKELHAKGITSNKPVIMLSNLDSDNIIQECYKFGAREALSKATIEPTKIIETVAKYLS